MNSILLFSSVVIFNQAVTAIELDASPEYKLDVDNLAILTNDSIGIVTILNSNDIYKFDVESNEEETERVPTFFDDDEDADETADVENYFASDRIGCLGDEE